MAEVKNGGNENVEIKERKDKLLITKENSNKKEKEDIYSVKNIHAEVLFIIHNYLQLIFLFIEICLWW